MISLSKRLLVLSAAWALLLTALAFPGSAQTGSPCPCGSAAGVARQVLEAAGVTIDYRSQGQGPALIMLPSLGRGAADFDELAARLAAAGYRVLRPEPRGVGASFGPMQGVSYHDLVKDLVALIEHERAAPAVIIGHAYGSAVGRTLAADRPDLVRGVVLVAAAGRSPLDGAIRDSIDRSGDLALPDAVRLPYLARGFFAPGNDASVWLTGWHPATKAMGWDATRRTPLDQFIGAGRAPILDLQGEQDTVAPHANSLSLRNELGADRVTVVVVPNAGHALLPEQPDAAAAAILEWLSRLPR